MLTTGSPTAPRSALELKLTRIWEKLLNTSDIGVHDDFFRLGGDSISAMALLALVAQETGYMLPTGGLLQASTIAKLASTLTNGVDAENWSPLVPIQTSGAKRPIFCIHPGGGNVLCYLQLSRSLGPDQPFYGLQAPGVDGVRDPLKRVEDMAEEYIRAIRECQPTGPYCVIGWSAGGVIAYEIAQQLKSAGEEIAHLGIIDSGVLYTMGVLRAVCPADEPGAFEVMGRTPAQQVSVFRVRSGAAKLIPDEADQEMAIRIMQLFQSNVEAVVRYRPQPYDDRVDIYQARELLVASRRQPFAEWNTHCADLHLHYVPGNHLTMIHEPHVEHLAAALTRGLKQSMELPSTA
jgi:pyochelin synthetase